MPHPRNLGRAWLRAIPTVDDAGDAARIEVPRRAALAPVPTLELVPTSEETRRLLGVTVHRMTRDECAAWDALDPSDRDEARRAIREAVREQGGGELRDWRGRLVERID